MSGKGEIKVLERAEIKMRDMIAEGISVCSGMIRRSFYVIQNN